MMCARHQSSRWSVGSRRSVVLGLGALVLAGFCRRGFADETMVQLLYQGEFLADYHQIYLCDEANETLPDDYTEETIAPRLMAGPHGIIVHTARNLTVPIRVEWHAARPEPDLAAFQHVAEAGFTCSAGRLVLAGLTDYVPTAPRLTVPAGPLGVRACFVGLDTLDEYGIEGQDRYLVQLWPGPEPAQVRVLKAWPPA